MKSQKQSTAEMLPQFQLAGSTLHSCGCNNSHSGNLSIRNDDEIIITRTGSMLSALTESDLVTTSTEPTDLERKKASSELVVHLAIYEKTKAKAIAHGHALWAVLAGWITDTVTPLDVEAAFYFGKIPVVESVPATASPLLGECLAQSLSTSPVTILRGHGAFAIGDTIEQAMQRVCSVNDSCHLFVEAHRLQLDVDELADKDYLKFDKPS